MKYTGMSRPMDELGRVVIPKEIRNTLNIKEKDKLDISVDGEAIILKKCGDHCVICGGADNLRAVDDKYICDECAEKIRNI